MKLCALGCLLIAFNSRLAHSQPINTTYEEPIYVPVIDGTMVLQPIAYPGQLPAAVPASNQRPHTSGHHGRRPKGRYGHKPMKQHDQNTYGHLVETENYGPYHGGRNGKAQRQESQASDPTITEVSSSTSSTNSGPGDPSSTGSTMTHIPSKGSTKHHLHTTKTTKKSNMAAWMWSLTGLVLLPLLCLLCCCLCCYFYYVCDCAKTKVPKTESLHIVSPTTGPQGPELPPAIMTPGEFGGVTITEVKDVPVTQDNPVEKPAHDGSVVAPLTTESLNSLDGSSRSEKSES
ncbi:hypothetical protein HDE_11518 [Halotydeus destructor]|nr:hypothetical protein HDE_11518 [Halotydeus destructor]